MRVGPATLLSTSTILLCGYLFGGAFSQSQSSGFLPSGVQKPIQDQNQGAITPPAPTPPDLAQKAKAANDAAKAMEQAVSGAKGPVADAGKYTKIIADLTGADPKHRSTPLDDMQAIQAALEAMRAQGQSGLLDLLSKAKGSLDKAAKGDSLEKTLVAVCTALTQAAGQGTSSYPDVNDAISSCSNTQSDGDAEFGALSDAISVLQTKLQGLYQYAVTRVSGLSSQLKPFDSLVAESTSNSASLPAPATQTGGSGGAPGGAAPSGGSNTPTNAPATKGPAPEELIRILPAALPTLKSVLETEGPLKSAWDSVCPSLQSLLADSSQCGSDNPVDPKKVTAADVKKSFNDLDEAVKKITPNLSGWLAIIQSALLSNAASLDGTLSLVISDPAKNSASAVSSVRDQTDMIAAVQPILDACPPLFGYLPDAKTQKSTRKSFEGLQVALNTLSGAVSRMHDALAGDMSQFVTGQVSLYYFTDVQRLMHALNESTHTVGGVAEAQAQAAAQRQTLTQAEFELADAQGAVTRLQKQVSDLEEQQRQLQAKLGNQNSQVSKLASRLRSTQDTKDMTETNYQNALSAQQQNPNDPTKANALQTATLKRTATTTNLSHAQSDYDDATKQRDTTQGQVNDSQNQSDSLPAKLQAARDALSAAQIAVSQDRRKMLMAAQAESDAFAFARDNAPYLYAPADASSSDPAKRAILYAFNDSKIIFMRGKPDDLLIVKEIIATFDQPAPQARLALWTFELSADSGQRTSRKSAEQLNHSMEIVDEELSTTRALENTTLSLFRKLINDQVQAVEKACQVPNSGCDNKPVWKQNGGRLATQADFAKWQRIHIYNSDVLNELQFNLEKPNLDLLRNLIPDPSATTTLGEALLILSLTKPEFQVNVRQRFKECLKEALKELPTIKGLKKKDTKTSDFLPPDTDLDDPLVLTWRILGIGPGKDACSSAQCAPAAAQNAASGGNASNSLSASQLEIVRALRSAYSTAVMKDAQSKLGAWYRELSSLVSTQSQLQAQTDTIKKKGVLTLVPADQRNVAELEKNVAQHAAELRGLQAKPLPLKDDESHRLENLQKEEQNFDDLFHKGIDSLQEQVKGAYYSEKASLSAVTARIESIRESSAPYVQLLTEGFGFSPFSPLESSDSQAQRIRKDFLRVFPPNENAPRIAAADEMLKEMIIAFEDDLDRLFIQPMISRLRIRLISEPGVRVGILQRESLLATNRGVARIDPRATAQLAVGDQEDILSSIQQLAQVYAAVQSGGALAALGALQQQPRQPQPEIYALTTGNRFQVTPIFDPTGQALRFKFDFVSSSTLEEPNGTTNPQLSHVERVTVNTEVQLSNLETREIARFESNAKLGLPDQYWGGLPIVKDLPPPNIRKWFPLVGWFVWKHGSNASAQQSVIFGQTTIYPTISEIVNLLSQSKTDSLIQNLPSH